MQLVIATVALTATACAAPKPSGTSRSCPREPVSAIPPDTLPAWFGHDSSWANVFLKHIIAVRFDSSATIADRRRAIESVCGRVVGGWHLAGPSEDIYAVQVADGGDPRRLDEFIARIRVQPRVASASMETLISWQDVTTAPARVPAEAPDTVPAWVVADSTQTGPTRYIPVRFTKNIIGVQFKSDATSSQRQSAIDAVFGRVIGGYRAAGIYLVWVQDPGDGSGIIGAVERLESLPFVAGATPDMATQPND
jgi:hypothetical protein